MSQLSKQLEELYAARKTEVFDTKNWHQLRFQKKQVGNEPAYTVEITLKDSPIPASLQVSRQSLVVPPELIEVRAKTIKFVTYSDKWEGPRDSIFVSYYPRALSVERAPAARIPQR